MYGSDVSEHFKTMFFHGDSYLREKYYDSEQKQPNVSQFKIPNSDNTYEISWDNFGRRRTFDEDSNKDKYAVFLGCSLIFGDGISDKETLPYFFGSYSKDYEAYNYALSGASPNIFLYLLSQRDISLEIKQSSGIVYYFYQTNHLLRSTAHISTINFAWPEPMYEFDKNKQLVLTEDLATLDYFKRFVEKSLLLKNIIPLIDTKKAKDDAHELTCEIINQLAKKVNQRLENAEFITVLYPGESDQRMGKCLMNKGVKVIDFSMKSRDPKLRTHWDGFHPSMQENEALSRLLIESL